jgi:hypothetical protein
MRLGGTRWDSCNSTCSVCEGPMLLFLYTLVGNGLSSCFVVPMLGDDVGGLIDIVSVYGWVSRLDRGLCLVPVYRSLDSAVSW